MARAAGHFPEKTRQALRGRAGDRCSREKCGRSTSGPSTNDAEKSVCVGEAAHIRAASKGGPRYDSVFPASQVHSTENGIWLCSFCATLIDKNGGADYSVETLLAWKSAAEEGAREAFESGVESIYRAPRVEVSRVLHSMADRLVGREEELQCLDNALINRDAAQSRINILTFTGWGGSGKTSLISEWLQLLSVREWHGCKAVFGWTFYNQSALVENVSAADEFFSAAIEFFTDEKTADPPRSRAVHLAKLVRSTPALLILDGLEVLQQRDDSISDPEMALFLRELAFDNGGLCVITTRQKIKDLIPFQGKVPQIELVQLSVAAGKALLVSLGVKGLESEIEALVGQLDGHALSLDLCGRYLKVAHGGDVRYWTEFGILDADNVLTDGHAFRVMQAYEKWFSKQGVIGEQLLAALNIVSLFEGFADGSLIDELFNGSSLPNFTQPFEAASSSDEDSISAWRVTVAKLKSYGLLKQRDGTAEHVSRRSSLQAHPLVREYFLERAKKVAPDHTREAHRRLFDLLSSPIPWLGDLANTMRFYDAIGHGCFAGEHDRAWEMYIDRIHKGDAAIKGLKHFGLYQRDLVALRGFFDKPWTKPAACLNTRNHAMAFAFAGYDLRAVGQIESAIAPMIKERQLFVDQENWSEASRSCSNLSQSYATLGDFSRALKHGREGIKYSRRSRNPFDLYIRLAAQADAYLAAGQLRNSLRLFRLAEALQRKDQPQFPWLYSYRGARFCDLLLIPLERAAWLQVPHRVLGQSEWGAWAEKISNEVTQRLNAAPISEEKAGKTSLLNQGLREMLLAQLLMYRGLLRNSSEDLSLARLAVEPALTSLRRAGQLDELPRGLLARASMLFLGNENDAARSDLDEAWAIASRGPMRPFLVDILVSRVRLFNLEEGYPWENSRRDLKAARELIEKTGYLRRLGELEHLERTLAVN
jgi:tetratricopeptide (TPR) repeat protein